MKSKPIKVDHGHVITSSTKSGLIRVEVSEGINFTPVWEFFLPKSTRDAHGFISTEIIKARMKHDFNVELGHYSTTLCL